MVIAWRHRGTHHAPDLPTARPPARVLRGPAHRRAGRRGAGGRRVAGLGGDRHPVRAPRARRGRVLPVQEADAADAAASTWLRAMEGLPALRDPDRLGGWLRTIARRECLGVLRQNVFEEPSDIAAAAMPAAEPGPEAVVVACEVGRVISDAMAHLSGRGQRLILALFFLPRARTPRSPPTPRSDRSIGPTRKRALGALRVGLERAGYGPDALAA